MLKHDTSEFSSLFTVFEQNKSFVAMAKTGKFVCMKNSNCPLKHN